MFQLSTFSWMEVKRGLLDSDKILDLPEILTFTFYSLITQSKHLQSQKFQNHKLTSIIMLEDVNICLLEIDRTGRKKNKQVYK